MPEKFSERTNWSLSPNALSQALERLKRDGPVIDLTVSNPTRCGIPQPGPDILNALFQPGNLSYDPCPRGLLPAREAVCEYYRKKGIAVSPEQIFLTSSTSEAYSFLFRLLVDPWETVLFPRPSYPLFNFLADINDVDSDFYPLNYDGEWRIGVNSIEGLLTPAVKAVVLVNPNNPTGSCVSAEDLSRLSAVCRREQVPLLVDEVFWDYLFKPDEAPVSSAGNDGCLTFTMGGVSKALGLPQMKFSWIVISGPDAQAREAAQRLDVIADTFLSVNTPVQNAFPSWMKILPEIQGPILERVRANRVLVAEVLRGHKNMTLLNAAGGWSAVLRFVDGRGEEQCVLDVLEKERVYVHPGYFFDFNDGDGATVVISLLLPPDILREGLLKFIRNVGGSYE